MLDPELDAAVDRFALAMKARLLKKQNDGFVGWNDPAVIPTANLIDRIQDTAVLTPIAGAVDTANLAMMLWYRRHVQKSV